MTEMQKQLSLTMMGIEWPSIPHVRNSYYPYHMGIAIVGRAIRDMVNRSLIEQPFQNPRDPLL